MLQIRRLGGLGNDEMLDYVMNNIGTVKPCSLLSRSFQPPVFDCLQYVNIVRTNNWWWEWPGNEARTAYFYILVHLSAELTWTDQHSPAGHA